MNVLVAEDNSVSLSLAKKTLEQAGHKVITAVDGGEAWKLLRENKIQVVVTDWIMPEMNGVELCRKIRESGFPYYVYLILLTAKDDQDDLIRGFESGADDFLIKPVKTGELKARVRAGERIIELEENLKNSQAQLLQSEKMASVGQLAAGVAHEINNPTGFVSSNLKSLSDYHDDIGSLIELYRELIASLNGDLPAGIKDLLGKIKSFEEEADIDFILDDIHDLIDESKEGTERIKNIVLDLKDFAHPGEDEVQTVDINSGIESTLNVVWNEIKYKATVKKDYGDLPPVECFPQQLNQVFMNILVNAAQAMEKQGEIRIATITDNDWIEIEISDTGTGIPADKLAKIFDPFFTTKEVGKGTGLGLNVAYNIVKKHNGDITVESELGKGTTFRIRIPIEGL